MLFVGADHDGGGAEVEVGAAHDGVVTPYAGCAAVPVDPLLFVGVDTVVVDEKKPPRLPPAVGIVIVGVGADPIFISYPLGCWYGDDDDDADGAVGVVGVALTLTLLLTGVACPVSSLSLEARFNSICSKSLRV